VILFLLLLAVFLKRGSGTFIYNNYRQSLRIINEDSYALQALSAELGIGPADYERYLEEERAFLKGLRTEPVEVTNEIAYIEALQKLDKTLYVACYYEQFFVLINV
jgi:hypothetical protein